MRHVAATAAAIATLALVAACGGGGGGGSTASSSGGGGDAVTAVNAACASANRKVAALPTPQSPAAVLGYLEATEDAVDGLRSEVAAADGSAAVGKYADALETAVGILDEMANAARSRNPDAVRELSESLVDLRVGRVAAAAGLDVCAEAPVGES